MKEYIKVLDDLRPDEIRFKSDPLNKNLCFGGSPPPPPPPLPKIKLPDIEIGGSAGEILDAGKDAGEAAADAASTNLQSGATGVRTALATTKSNIGGLADDISGGLKYYKERIAEKMGVGDILGGIKEVAMGGGDPGSKEAPGKSETIGQGGQGGMKSASMEAVKKTAAGASGKRRLRKISKSGAKV